MGVGVGVGAGVVEVVVVVVLACLLRCGLLPAISHPSDARMRPFEDLPMVIARVK